MVNTANGQLMTPGRMSLSMAVANIETMIDWYGAHLGFEVVGRRDFPEYGTRIAFVESGDCRLEFIEDKNVVHLERPDPPRHTMLSGMSQLTFYTDDIEEIVSRAKDKPITVAWDLITVEDLGMKEFFIRDPENNIVQFVERFRM